MAERQGWTLIEGAYELQPGEMAAYQLEDRRIVVFHLDTGEFCAADDGCTHALAFLSEGWLEGEEVECPLHGGRFNVRTGAGLCAPIEKDIRIYPVRLVDNQVLVQF